MLVTANLNDRSSSFFLFSHSQRRDGYRHFTLVCHFFHFHCLIIKRMYQSVYYYYVYILHTISLVYTDLFGSVETSISIINSFLFFYYFSLVCLLELHGWMFGRDYGVLATLLRPLPQLAYSSDQHRGRRSSHEGSCSTIVFFPLFYYYNTQARLSNLALLFWCRGNEFKKKNNNINNQPKKLCSNKKREKTRRFFKFLFSRSIWKLAIIMYTTWLTLWLFFCSLKC